MTSIESGPPGLEVTHRWNNVVTLNDMTTRPRYRLNKITGLHSGAPALPQELPNVGRSGALPLPSYTGPKDVVYEGVIEAKTLDSMRVAQNGLRAAFRNKDSVCAMVLGGGGPVPWQYGARCTAFDSDDENIAGPFHIFPYQRTFTIGLRMYDRRFYAIGSPMVGSVGNGVETNLHNAGTTDSLPYLGGPVALNSTPLFTNVSVLTQGTNAKLKFKPLPVAGTLAIDFLLQQAYIGALDVTGYIDLTVSTWWDDDCDGLKPGENNVSGSGLAGNWTFAYYPAAE